MNYDEALRFINDSKKYGIVLGLNNMYNLMNELGNIQDKIKIIHIAGTNGKGSVGAFVESVLISAGFKTGRYISPTITEYFERFQINGKFIQKENFCRLCEKVKNVTDKIVSEGKSHPTDFEVETAIAFLYFYEERCDFVLLETGLGGRLDATNIIKANLCSVITSISFDHTHFLGNSLNEIAFEKCGIIKEKCSVISMFQNKEVMNVIQKKCKEKKSELITVSKSDILYRGFEEYVQKFDYKSYKNIKISLLGKFQIENASLAIEVIEFLKKKNYGITDKNIYDGFINTVWQGRFQILNKNPLFIADGAHNEDAAKRLAENIMLYFKNKKIIFIVGIFKDKDYKKIVEMTAKLAYKIFVFTLNDSRGLDADILLKEFLLYNENVKIVSDVQTAVSESFLETEKNSVIIAFGSLSYMGDLIEIMKKRIVFKETI